MTTISADPTAAQHIRQALTNAGWFNDGDQPATLTDNARTVLARRYLRKNDEGNPVETPDQMFRRVAANLSQADKIYGDEGDRERAERDFYDVMRNLYLLPNSPTLMNAGLELQQLSACFVLPIDDTLDDIFTQVKNTALIHKSGGGTGFSFSRLRPSGDRVGSTGGVASGPVSFIGAFDGATEAVKQGGTRRGANMGILHVTHPDIMEFITAKADGKRLQNFNISVAVTEEFMQQVQTRQNYDLINPRNGAVTGQLNAREVFDQIVAMAWATGDPGLVFLDAVNEDHPNPHLGDIESTNPCGEQPLLPYESCNLGSLNLARMTRLDDDEIVIDYDLLRRTIHTAVHLLDNVIDMNHYPIPPIEEMSKITRRIGLGVMGWADLLVQLGIAYDSDAAVGLAHELMEWIRQTTHDASNQLARQRSPYPAWNGSSYQDEMRNTSPTTIAPTGTISIIAGTSHGIEPHFALSYTRNVMDQTKLVEVNPYLKMLAGYEGWDMAELTATIAATGNLDAASVPTWAKQLFRVSHQISPQWHVAIQAAFQAHTDNAVSKTINFPADATAADVETAFLMAWQQDCKGITIYRDGSKPDQVLSITGSDGTEHGTEHGTANGASGGAAQARTPRSRPRRMHGVTQRVRTGHGNMYVTVNLDEEGLPFEVFGNMGKAGGCDAALLEAVSRVVSLALRGGIDSAEIAEQLRGITCCPAWDEGRQVLSSPDAIALVMANIGEPERESEGEAGNGHQQLMLPATPPVQVASRANGFQTRCPDCAGEVTPQEGCLTCAACGWSRC